MGLNVSPTTPITHIIDGVGGDVEKESKLLSGQTCGLQFSDHRNILLKELATGVLRSLVRLGGVIAASFTIFVAHVVGMGAKEQVIRINTHRVVATMKNIKPIRYSTDVQLITDTVGKYFRFGAAFAYHAVSFIVFIGRPKMASRSNFNLGLEPVFEGVSHNSTLCLEWVFTHYSHKRRVFQ